MTGRFPPHHHHMQSKLLFDRSDPHLWIEIFFSCFIIQSREDGAFGSRNPSEEKEGVCWYKSQTSEETVGSEEGKICDESVQFLIRGPILSNFPARWQSDVGVYGEGSHGGFLEVILWMCIAAASVLERWIGMGPKGTILTLASKLVMLVMVCTSLPAASSPPLSWTFISEIAIADLNWPIAEWEGHTGIGD